MAKKPKTPQIYAASTHVGCVRGHNEDSFLAQSPLFVVADGMGGHEAGEVASEIAVNTISNYAPKEPNGPQLGEAIQKANLAILEGAATGLGKPGMGTTVTAAMIFDNQLLIAQVGDSRAYLLHNGQLQRITRDHSLVADLVEQGRLTEEEARIHPQRSVITRALGSDPNTMPDAYALRLSQGDRLLLCSDGLSGMVLDSRIESILNRYSDVQECCDKLIDEALKAGGLDNVTAIVVDPLKKETNPNEKLKMAKRRRALPFIWAAAIVLVLAAACIGFYTYANNSHFVITENGYVCIYRGLPGEVADMKVCWLEEQTDVKEETLIPAIKTRLKNGVQVDSYDAAKELIESYKQTSAATNAAQNTEQ